MIHTERNSPWPFTTKQGAPETATNAFELIKMEVDRFCIDYASTRARMPTNAELLYESCCIIFGSEIKSSQMGLESSTHMHSWLRDLLMSSEVIKRRARTRPLKEARKSRVTYLSINGKADIFEECSLEKQLRDYVDISRLIETDVTDEELQREACHIIQTMEDSSPTPSEVFPSFLTCLVKASTYWLESFRERAGIPRAESLGIVALDVGNQAFLSAAIPGLGIGDDGNEESPEDSALQITANETNGSHQNEATLANSGTSVVNEDNCYRRLALELTRFVRISMSERNPNRHVPTDAELQHQARWIFFEE